MSPFRREGADDETQEMDSGSPCRGTALPGDVRADDMSLFEDTLPLGDDEIAELETQLLGPGPNLEGDTQLLLEGAAEETLILDIPESPAADRNRRGGDHMFSGRSVEFCEETQVVVDDEEGTEKTVLLCDEGGLSDDATTPCGIGCGDGGERTGDRLSLWTSTLHPLTRVSEQVSEERPMVAQASACDDNRTAGPLRRRSFTEVHAAAVRASGLAAARNATLGKLDADKFPSSCSNHSSMDEDGCEVLNENHGQFIDSRLGANSLVVGIENSDNYTSNEHAQKVIQKIGNLAVRKLNFEEGLSYVDFQEPGEQSQADALDAVDRFLSIHDVDFSQDTHPGKSCATMTPFVSDRKGTNYLAKMGRGSPVGKVGVYDWIDTVEDEHGGDFFCKKKDLFFGNSRHINKSLIDPWHITNKIEKHDGTHPKIVVDKVTLSSLKPRVEHDICSRTLASQLPTNDNTCKEISEQLHEESNTQQSPKHHAGRGGESVYDIGPDTQIAAEAMEALISGPCMSGPEGHSTNSNAEIVVGCTNIHAQRKRTSVSFMSKRKTRTTIDIGGGSKPRRSNRIKILNMESSLNDSSSSKQSLATSKIKRGRRIRKEIISSDAETEKKLCKLNSSECKPNGNSSKSVWGEKVHRRLQRSSTRSSIDAEKQVLEFFKAEMGACVKQMGQSVNNVVDGCASSLLSEDQVSFSKELIQKENNLCGPPVAHRTRKRKAIAVENLGMVSAYDEIRKDAVEVKTIPTNRKQARIVADAPKHSSNQGEGSNWTNISNKFDEQKISTLPEEQHRKNVLPGTSTGFWKPRTRRKNKFRNNNQATEPKDSSFLWQATETAVSCPLPQDNLAHVGNPNVSWNSANNLSKVDSAGAPSKTDTATASGKGSLVASDIRTRSTVSFHSRISCRDFTPGGSSLSNLGHSTNMNEELLQEMELNSLYPASFHANQEIQSSSDGRNAIQNSGLLDDREEVITSGSVSLAQQKLKESPVCTSLEPLKITQKRKSVSKPSIARELTRLESTEAASSVGSKARRRRDIKSVRVCLSHHLDDDIIKHQKKILARFGVSTVTTVSDATHFIADKFVRTMNMLEAMAVGKPVVTHLWLESCGQANCFIDEKNYILRDARKEKEIGYSMPASLALARQRPLLQGKRVLVTANVKPDKKLVAGLVMAAQGQPIERLCRSAIKDDKLLDDLLIVSCEEDFTICKPLLEKGAEAFSSELLLNGIVIQKLEYDRHRLFLSHVKKTRSSIWLRSEDGNQFLPVSKCT